MVSPIDPNEVIMTGENSFIRLHTDAEGPHTTRASHWRVDFSPGGQGHALFLKSDVTNDQVRIYADNIAMARWLQEEIESFLFPEFSDVSIPVVDAVFSKSGDAGTFWTEAIESEDETVLMTWYDFIDSFIVHTQPDRAGGRPLGVCTCMIPAQRAQLTLNGAVAQGEPHPEPRGDRTTSTACLALSESWLRPR